MTREEAHAQAEREVLEYARGVHLDRVRKPKDDDDLVLTYGMLRAACKDLSRVMESGELRTGDIIAFGSLCVLFLRECHLKHYNQKPPGEA